jgi:hypothetical protein
MEGEAPAEPFSFIQAADQDHRWGTRVRPDKNFMEGAAPSAPRLRNSEPSKMKFQKQVASYKDRLHFFNTLLGCGNA